MPRVWGISDLHVSLARPQRRERLAGRWREHPERIERGWREVVAEGDVVLLPGDLSMARNHRDLQPDLEWLERLPGLKVISQGNHDTWWNNVGAVRRLLRSSLRAVGGDAIEADGIIACGTRGAAVPVEGSSGDEKSAWCGELAALEEALAAAARVRSDQPVFVLWHHPPFDRYGQPSEVVSLLSAAKVTACVYGHVHQLGQWSRAIQGLVGGVKYSCVSSDAVGFRPLRLL